MICAFAIALMPTQATSATMSSSAPAANDSETTPPLRHAPTRSAMVKHKFREKKAKGKKRPGRTAARSIARHPWCGHTEKKQRYGIKVFGKYFNVVTHKTGLTSCC